MLADHREAVRVGQSLDDLMRVPDALFKQNGRRLGYSYGGLKNYFASLSPQENSERPRSTDGSCSPMEQSVTCLVTQR
jgi:hypothetical protein